jgi:cobalt-zinc-cadmium efflux system outer membrane protein
MAFAIGRLGAVAAGLLLAAGCLYPVRQKIDGDLCDLSARPVDLQLVEDDAAPQSTAARTPSPSRDQSAPDTQTANVIEQLAPAAYQPGDKKAPPGEGDKQDPLKRKLEVPPELYLGQAPLDISARQYPPLPPLPPDPQPAPGPAGKPLTLADLQRLARAHSPLIVQARANVEAARGQAIQAGLPPNPIFSFQQDTAGATGGPGYPGFALEQILKTAGKLQLQRAAATMDLLNAELAYRRAQTDLATRVRSGYFSVLVAQENLRIARTLVRLADTTYQIQARRASKEVGLSYPYEPLQLRAQARLVRVSYNQIVQHYLSSWKQLAATLGTIGMPPTELAGRIDIPVPVFHYDQVLTRVLQSHTDVRTADNTLLRARYNMQQARLTPIPDVGARALIQKDYTGPPFNVVYSVQLSMPLPLWDRNQGGIIAAQANLIQATEEAHRVRTDLTTRLAAAFENYRTNLVALREYRTGIIPDQLKAYESLSNRYRVEGGLAPAVPDQAGPVGFGDVANTQQILIQYYAAYFASLDALWQSVVSVADLLQTDDLFQVGLGLEMGEAPPCAADLEKLPNLPCFHPCSPLPGRSYEGADSDWPSPLLKPGAPAMPPAAETKETAPPAAPEAPLPPRPIPEKSPASGNPPSPVLPPAPLRLREAPQPRTPAEPGGAPWDLLPEVPRPTPKSKEDK